MSKPVKVSFAKVKRRKFIITPAVTSVCSVEDDSGAGASFTLSSADSGLSCSSFSEGGEVSSCNCSSEPAGSLCSLLGSSDSDGVISVFSCTASGIATQMPLLHTSLAFPQSSLVMHWSPRTSSLIVDSLPELVLPSVHIALSCFQMPESQTALTTLSPDEQDKYCSSPSEHSDSLHSCNSVTLQVLSKLQSCRSAENQNVQKEKSNICLVHQEKG